MHWFRDEGNIKRIKIIHFSILIFSHLFFKADGSRSYEINGRKYSIPSFLVKTLQAWNSVPEHSASMDIDRKFVEALLICFIGKQNLISGNIDRKLLRFVRDLFRYRVKSAERLQKFDEYYANKREALNK